MDINNIIIGGMQTHQTIKTDGICTCLTSSIGMGGEYIPMIVVKENEYTQNNQSGFANIIINDRGFTNKSPQISYGICPTLRAENHGNLPKVIKYE